MHNLELVDEGKKVLSFLEDLSDLQMKQKDINEVGLFSHNYFQSIDLITLHDGLSGVLHIKIKICYT